MLSRELYTRGNSAAVLAFLACQYSIWHTPRGSTHLAHLLQPRYNVSVQPCSEMLYWTWFLSPNERLAWPVQLATAT